MAQQGDWHLLLPPYKTLPELGKGRPADVLRVVIESVRAVCNERHEPRPVIRDAEGNVWVFRAPQHVHSLLLEPGYGIDVQKWESILPGAL